MILTDEARRRFHEELHNVLVENTRLREALMKIKRQVAWSSEIGQIVHAALAKEKVEQ